MHAGTMHPAEGGGARPSAHTQNREAAMGVQMFHLRQRWGAAVWRAQRQILLARPKCAVPEWEVGGGRGAPCSGHSSGGQLQRTGRRARRRDRRGSLVCQAPVVWPRCMQAQAQVSQQGMQAQRMQAQCTQAQGAQAQCMQARAPFVGIPACHPKKMPLWKPAA
jgi:hypothetical protein